MAQEGIPSEGLRRTMEGEVHRPMRLGQETIASLCAPVAEMTCFHCCPPIRPVGHDTEGLRKVWSSALRHNSRQIHLRLSAPRPIDGRTCWALGFLDDEERRVGCLLHPQRHRGDDLRHLVDFGGKCAREMCQEAKVFDGLDQEERRWCLGCVPSGDSFAYSSRRSNPIFRLLAWEEVVIRALVRRESGIPMRRQRLLQEYSPLFTLLEPKVDGYWIGRFLQKGDRGFLQGHGLAAYVCFRDSLSHELRRSWGKRGPEGHDGLPMVHAHPIPLSLSRWLKFGVGIWRASMEEMTAILEVMEQRFEALAGAERP